MKSFILGVLFFVTSITTYGQWTTSGNNIQNTNSGHVIMGTSPSSGNVGIGLTNPVNRLDIVGNNPKIKLQNSGGPPSTTTVELTGVGVTGAFEIKGIQINGGPIIGNVRVGSKNSYDFSLFTNDVDRFTVNASGNVGIGITSPSHKLDVNGVIGINGVGVINTGNSNGNDIYINSRVIRNESNTYPDGMYIGYNSNGGANAHLRFYANGTTERLRIDASTGNVGIGTTTPAYLLDVNGAINATAIYVNGQPVSGGGSGGSSPWSLSGSNVYLSSGSVGIGTTTPNSSLHLLAPAAASTWVNIDKSSSGVENGLRFSVAGETKFYVYSDNDGSNALKIQATGLTGEDDNLPRMQFPLSNKNIYMAQSGGSVGIGTSNPYSSSRLHVKAPSANPWGILAEASSNDRVIGISHTGTHGVVAVSYLGASGYSPLQFWTENSPRMTIGTNGNIGIGTTAPDEKLTVKGNIHAEEVVIDLSVPGPDYVFEENYDLPSLTEVEDYIKQYKHLPEVPAAKEMEERGIRSGEMDMLLLKKVEELTLYVIELKKENENQKETIEMLKEEIVKISNR